MIEKRKEGGGLGGGCGAGERQEPGEVRRDQHLGGADTRRNQDLVLV